MLLGQIDSGSVVSTSASQQKVLELNTYNGQVQQQSCSHGGSFSTGLLEHLSILVWTRTNSEIGYLLGWVFCDKSKLKI